MDYYVRLLRTTYAARLARAFSPEDFAAVFADADQLSLFEPPIEAVRTVLTELPVEIRAGVGPRGPASGTLSRRGSE